MILALRNIRRNPRRSGITIAATAISVVLCIVTVSLSDGWYRELVRAATRFDVGHVQVHATGYLPDRTLHRTMSGGVLDAARDVSGGRAAPRVSSVALAAAAERSAPALIVGIDPVSEAGVTDLAAAVDPGGRMLAAYGEAVLGSRLAARLRLAVGQTFLVLAEADDGFPGEAEYRVVGTVTTGDDSRDRGLILVHIEDARRLLALEGRTHEIALVTGDWEHPELAAERLRAVLGPGLEVVEWKALRPVIWGTLRLADGAVWIVLGVVFGLAGLGIANSVTTSVLERTRELGLLMALGMRPFRVVAMVLEETGFLAGIAAIAGGVLGLALAWWLESHGLDLRGFGAGISQGGITVGPIIHARVLPARLLATAAALLAVAIVAAVGPAIRVTRLDPAVATRAR